MFDFSRSSFRSLHKIKSCHAKKRNEGMKSILLFFISHRISAFFKLTQKKTQLFCWSWLENCMVSCRRGKVLVIACVTVLTGGLGHSVKHHNKNHVVRLICISPVKALDECPMRWSDFCQRIYWFCEIISHRNMKIAQDERVTRQVTDYVLQNYVKCLLTLWHCWFNSVVIHEAVVEVVLYFITPTCDSVVLPPAC